MSFIFLRPSAKSCVFCWWDGVIASAARPQWVDEALYKTITEFVMSKQDVWFDLKMYLRYISYFITTMLHCTSCKLVPHWRHLLISCNSSDIIRLLAPLKLSYPITIPTCYTLTQNILSYMPCMCIYWYIIFNIYVWYKLVAEINNLVQVCCISIANALDILQSCTKPSIYHDYGQVIWLILLHIYTL